MQLADFLRTVAAVLVAAGPASAQFLELGKRHLVATEKWTRCVAFVDVEADRDLDLVFGEGTSAGQLERLYLNDGQARFADATAARMPSRGSGRAVVVGDVDGDADPDLVYAAYQGQNRLLLNDGSGFFADATGSKMPALSYPTNAVAIGDVEGDGDLDLVFGNGESLSGPINQNRLYLNDGTGSFADATAAQWPAAGRLTYSVALGDVDGDGDLDVVSGDHFQNRLFLNDGGGVFTEAPAGSMPVDSDATEGLAMGDVDGDGDLDLVLANGRGIGPVSPPSTIERLYLNDGTGRFSDVTATHLPALDPTSRGVGLGDVDADGDLDIVFARHLYLNDGTGSFTDATAARMPVASAYAEAVAVADADRDGDLDLAFAGSRFNGLYLNDGGGTFADAARPRLPRVASITEDVAFGDIDGDDDTDLVLSRGIYRNDGQAFFTDVTASSFSSGLGQTKALALVDVDADGAVDLVLGNGPGQNQLFLNTGTGTFVDVTASRLPPDSDYTTAVAVGDMDGDADLDLFFGNSFGSSDRLYLNAGTGTFVDVTAQGLPANGDQTNDAALVDVDADGDLDLVLANTFQNRLYRNDGAGVFTDVTSTHMPVDRDNTFGVAAGDVDRDGDVDIVFGNSPGLSSGQNWLYRNDGTGRFSDATTGGLPAATYWTMDVVLGDLDEDGDLDLVATNDQQQNRLYSNDGSGVFRDATATQLPQDADEARAVAVGDVDGDDDLDLFFGNGDGRVAFENNRLYLNGRRQVDAAFLARVNYSYHLDFYAEPGLATAPHGAVPFLALALATPPLRIPGLGFVRLDAASLVQLPAVVLPAPSHVATLSFTIPPLPALRQQSLYTQAVILYSVTPLEVRLSNVVADVVF